MGQLVVVAGRTLGRGIALGLPHNGASVIIAHHNLDTAQDTADFALKGGFDRKLVLGGDGTVEDGIKTLVDGVVNCFGKRDVMINNVGGISGVVVTNVSALGYLNGLAASIYTICKTSIHKLVQLAAPERRFRVKRRLDAGLQV